MTTEELPEGVLELELTVLQLDDDQLKQALVIIGRELGRRGLGTWEEKD